MANLTRPSPPDISLLSRRYLPAVNNQHHTIILTSPPVSRERAPLSCHPLGLDMWDGEGRNAAARLVRR
jgi:hypothetical protein